MSTALEARGIPVNPETLEVEVEGELEEGVGPERHTAPGRVSLVTKLRFHYRVKVPPGKAAAAERALIATERCAMIQSIQRGIAVERAWDIEELDG